jgi:putative transposase
VELAVLKATVGPMREKYAFSERRACGLMLLAVTTYRYRSQRTDEPLRTKLVELAREKPRFGYRRLHVLLRRSGERVNHKRLHRIYCEAGLRIRRKKRKHCVREGKPLVARSAANQEWGLDFVHDAVACGRAIRVLSVVDAYTRECLALEVDTSFASRRVTRVLEAIVAERGVPQAIRCDNGPELTSRHFLAWCVERQIELLHIQPGKPTQNARIESFPRTAAGRVFDCELVSELIRCAEKDRGVEDRVQRGAPAQQFGIPNAERVCDGAGSGLLHS